MLYMYVPIIIYQEQPRDIYKERSLSHQVADCDPSMMRGLFQLLDTILVPLSVLVTMGYHAYLWRHMKTNPSGTTIGINILKRRCWLATAAGGAGVSDDKKAMLAVQSLRNTLMGTILTATVTVLITLALAALTNNAYKANHLLIATSSNSSSSSFLLLVMFGSQSERILMLKYGSATLFLLTSFLCSSMAVGCLIDANFLISGGGSSRYYTERIMERGFTLGVVGNRVLCITFPLLFWLFSPMAVLLSSIALVFAFYALDFTTTTTTTSATFSSSV